MITSPSNERVKRVRLLQTQRRARLREARFVVEGVRLVEEAVNAGAALEFALYLESPAEGVRGRALLDTLRARNVLALPVSEAVMRACSDTETPQGILAVAEIPRLPLPEPVTFALVVDQLRDPGNLGTILRTAAAAGVELALLAPGTVDAYNPKVVRSAMGAHFRLPLRHQGWPEITSALSGLDVWLAEAEAEQPYWQVDWRRPAVLVVGGEAEGTSPEAEGFATGRVTIPMPGGAESLNAAAATAVLLFETVRQRSALGDPR
jgi:TrmH family RNA methyltransferase